MTVGDVFYSGRLGKASEETERARKPDWQLSWERSPSRGASVCRGPGGTHPRDAPDSSQHAGRLSRVESWKVVGMGRRGSWGLAGQGKGGEQAS